jgi:NAD+ kinase
MANGKLKIGTVGFFLRPNKPELKKDFNNLKKSFESFGIEVKIEKESAEMIGVDGIPIEELFKVSDIFISLGGDGTLLSTVRKSFYCNKPILPINGGQLGFLAGLKILEAHNFIQNLIDGNYKIEKRKILKIEFGDGEESFALNDIYITNRERMKMCSVQVFTDCNDEVCDRKLMNKYYGDALIISTPTGSTAYNLSSGGPILHPEMSSYILTPIAPHSLTQRPIVLPSRLNIYVGMEKSDGVLVVDGQDIRNLLEGDLIKVSVFKTAIRIIRVESYNFFETLREKLKWGGAESY